MSRLAIVIRAVGSIESLEGTLVSVLENRPADCEILVALDKPYSDPYELKDEVRFVQGPKRQGPTACINEALAATRAPIVHLLASGCTVTEGWTEPAVARFDDCRIAAVAPWSWMPNARTRSLPPGWPIAPADGACWSAKVEPTCPATRSRRSLDRAGLRLSTARPRSTAVGGLSTQLGPAQVDVELARALARAGYRAAVERQSKVFAMAEADACEGAFRQALHEERLFWRICLIPDASEPWWPMPAWWPSTCCAAFRDRRCS